MIALAHASHWLVWVVYAVPLAVVLVVVVLDAVRRRRNPGADEPPDDGASA